MSNILKLPQVCYYIFLLAGLAISIPEGLKPAKAFGKDKVLGVLMAIPVFKDVIRLFLGLGKAKFQAPAA